MTKSSSSDDTYNAAYYADNGQSGDRPALWMYERFWKRYCDKRGPVLEFGGGVGWFARRLTRHAKVFECESNAFARESLAQIAPEAIAVEDLSTMETDSVSSIVALHVLEHIPDDALSAIFAEFDRIARPGARFMFVMPDLDGAAHRAKGEGWSAFTDPTHINLKGHDAWQAFFRSVGLKPVQTFADGFYDFPYAQTLAGRAVFDSLRLARTGIQFLLARPLLKSGDGENIVFILERAE
ncbi:class I SAM-dependent methyltransferase [Hyphomonas beringensis]|nr:class I SAM-dependent methyltransferase [Hyphomonas beringensis]